MVLNSTSGRPEDWEPEVWIGNEATGGNMVTSEKTAGTKLFTAWFPTVLAVVSNVMFLYVICKCQLRSPFWVPAFGNLLVFSWSLSTLQVMRKPRPRCFWWFYVCFSSGFSSLCGTITKTVLNTARFRSRYSLHCSFSYFELQNPSNSTNWMTKSSKIEMTSAVRFELTAYWSSASHHNHYTKEPTVSGIHNVLSRFQLSLTGSSWIQLIHLIK